MTEPNPGGTTALDWQVARSVAFAAARRLGPEPVEMSDSLGRVTAEAVTAVQPIPHAATSAMDGWAVVGSPPWRVVPTGAAALQPGQATPIVTGGLITADVDAVLRSEFGRHVDDTLELRDGRDAPRRGTDIRPVGEEAAAGAQLIAIGTFLNPAHLAVAASCARDTLLVTMRPRVALLLTGDEVIETGIPAAGQVRDSFGSTLPALVSALGGQLVSTHRVPDRREATLRAIDEARDAELVMTTGGTGHSTADHIRPVLHELGAEVLVDRLSTRPGGPTLLARLPDGRLIVALAGNPLAAITGLLVVAAPAIAAWGGRGIPPLHQVAAARDILGHSRATLLSPYICLDEDAHGGVIPSDWIGSAMMRGLADAHGIMSVPPGGLSAGQHTAAMRLPWSVA